MTLMTNLKGIGGSERVDDKGAIAASKMKMILIEDTLIESKDFVEGDVVHVIGMYV